MVTEKLMKIADVLALTDVKPRSIYKWMEKHPTVDRPRKDSLVGHPFPKPSHKDGRQVVWDGSAVERWWEANQNTLGRHPVDGPTTIMSWTNFFAAMQEPPEDFEQDKGTGQVRPVHDMNLVQKMERVSPDEVKVWFRNVSDAVAFKLRWEPPTRAQIAERIRRTG